MLRNEFNQPFDPGLESAYAVIPCPSPAELMAKRVLDSLPPAKGAGRMPPAPRTRATADSAARFTITKSIRDWIRTTILAWPHPTVGWEDVRKVVQKKYPDGVWKRQSLARHPALQDAFRATKKRLSQEREGQRHPGRSAAGADDVARKRIRFLEARVKDLESENENLKNQFIRWQRNAFAAGMTEAQLDKPLKPIDRGQAGE